MKPKPDDRSDNVDRIQKNIDMTIHNMELADEFIDKTSDPKTKEALEEKNERPAARRWTACATRSRTKRNSKNN